jgi:hypothetical protein
MAMPNNVPHPAPGVRLPCRVCSRCDVQRSNLDELLKDEDTSGGRSGKKRTIGEGYGWGQFAIDLEQLAICARPDHKGPMLVFKTDTDPCPYFSEDRGRLLLADDRKIIVSVPGDASMLRRGKK